MLNRLYLLALFAVPVALVGCDSSDSDPIPDPVPDPVIVPIPAQTATDIEADLAVAFGPTGPQGRDLYTLYDLDAGEIVLSSNETDMAVRAADSASTAWDIGFRSTTIIFNGGISGPGQGSAQLLVDGFEAITEAPADGYLTDGTNGTCPEIQTPGGTFPGPPLAVCTGSDNGWYNYNAAINVVSPLPGRTIVLTTGEGNYAKVRILSYYLGAPAPEDLDPSEDPGRYYTFDYVVQPDGTRSFETTVEG
ncbi:MAG: HmuY family protein [Bacteroidota bacterium]